MNYKILTTGSHKYVVVPRLTPHGQLLVRWRLSQFIKGRYLNQMRNLSLKLTAEAGVNMLSSAGTVENIFGWLKRFSFKPLKKG